MAPVRFQLPQVLDHDYFAPMTRGVSQAVATIALIGTACLPGPVPSPGPDGPAPARIPPPEPTPLPVTEQPITETPSLVGLPPIPSVVGPIALHVVYPPAGARLSASDSNFIFGSVGSGTATLRINGQTVEVKPNGSFLAFLPVPPPSPSDSIVAYELEVAQGSDTVRAQHRVSLPPEPLALPSTGPAIVDSATLAPRSRMVLER